MTAADTASAFARRQRAVAATTAAAVAARWSMVDVDDIIGSWDELLPGVAGLVTAGQLRAAETGAAYTPAVLRAQGLDPRPAGLVQTAAFAGIASDGRPLDTLLGLPAVQSVGAIARGGRGADVMERGRKRLMMLAGTQVLDAGRQAAGVGMVSDRTVQGYRRQLTPPSCQRCVILAGAWYRWNTGFERHPNCDCVHVPAVGPKSDLGGVESFDPQAYFDGLSLEEQARTFTAAGAQAIRDGADMNQVVNARRGMKSTTAYGKKISTTIIGTSRRASAARAMEQALGAQFGRRQGDRMRRVSVPRLMPEQIYADARDRAQAIQLLKRFGYLHGGF